jgi:ribosomal protein L22
MGGVFSPAQIQKQVNASLARNDSRTAAQILQAQTELAGRGFSSNSPLLEALKSSYLGQNLRSNADAETQIRLQSAQANAEQILKAQELAVTETQAKQGIILENVKNVNTRLIGTAGVWAQLIGSAL